MPSEPTLRELGIAGVHLATSPVIEYNSSTLVEPHRAGWGGLYADPIEHMYWITTPRGVLRAWGCHEHTTDRYSVVSGSIEVALVDGRDASATAGAFIIVPLDAARGEGLLIPPGIWHTFRATSDVAVLFNSKNPPYDPDNVDKHRRLMPTELADFTWGD